MYMNNTDNSIKLLLLLCCCVVVAPDIYEAVIVRVSVGIFVHATKLYDIKYRLAFAAENTFML